MYMRWKALYSFVNRLRTSAVFGLFQANTPKTFSSTSFVVSSIFLRLGAWVSGERGERSIFLTIQIRTKWVVYICWRTTWVGVVHFFIKLFLLPWYCKFYSVKCFQNIFENPLIICHMAVISNHYSCLSPPTAYI